MDAATVSESSDFPQPAARMSGIKMVAIHARVPMRGLLSKRWATPAAAVLVVSVRLQQDYLVGRVFRFGENAAAGAAARRREPLRPEPYPSRPLVMRFA